MKRIKVLSLGIVCLLAIGACTENSGKKPNKKENPKKVERDFFDRGGSFK